MHSGVEAIRQYFPKLSSLQINQFEQLLPLYKEWNEKINVISRKDIEQLYERHVLHSLGIAKIVDFSDGAKVVDAGTGGGFPGIPLAIYFPQVNFLLVDSIGKKIRVVNEISSSIGLKNVISIHSRVEDIDQQFDFAVSRAVAPLAEMHKWLKPLIRKGNRSSLPNGMLFLKGGDLAEEIIQSGKKVQAFELKKYFNNEFFEAKKILFLPV